MKITRTGLVAVALVVSIVGTGVAYACLNGISYGATPVCTPYCDIRFTWAVSNDNGTVETRNGYGIIDPGDNGLDPNQAQTRGVALPTAGRYTKNVAATTAQVQTDPGYLNITLNNAYPFYFPTVFFGVKNYGSVPSKIESITIDESPDDPSLPPDIPEITVTLHDITVGQTLSTCQELLGRVTVLVNQVAKQNWVYKCRITIVTVCQIQECGGTPGFWRNSCTRFYSERNLLKWLKDIDQSSSWINDPTPSGGVFSISDMYRILDEGVSGGATAKSRFLRHYLCTRLNAACQTPRLYLEGTHNITGVGGYQYLPATNGTTYIPVPTAANLQQIINAIESKYSGPKNSPTGWTSDQRYNNMKDMCDGLNQEPPRF